MTPKELIDALQNKLQDKGMGDIIVEQCESNVSNQRPEEPLEIDGKVYKSYRDALPFDPANPVTIEIIGGGPMTDQEIEEHIRAERIKLYRKMHKNDQE